MQNISEIRKLTASKLVALARTYRRAVDAALATYGLSDATAWPVLHIGRLGDGVRQGVLADEIGIEGPSLVRLLDHLAAAELIIRKEDPTDRRAKMVYLTVTGRFLRERIEEVLAELRDRLFMEVSQQDLDACLRVFQQLESALASEPPNTAARRS